MYLFSRVALLGGGPRRTLPWVQQVTDHVRTETGLDVGAWAAEFGAPLGTTVWTAPVDSQAAFFEATAGLLGDEAYLDLVDTAQDMVAAPAEDSLRLLIHGGPADTEVGQIATTTTAVALVDRIDEAIAWSVDMAIHVEKAIDTPVSCWSGAYGQMGEMTWIGVAETDAAVDANAGTLAADEGYLERLRRGGELFLPGSAQQARFRRVA